MGQSVPVGGALSMIPVKLALRNFMPYRDSVPSLDFTAIHTVSISGSNGNGKSALIDAMTWALWGKSRARSDDDLIHLERDETEVEFDFAVGEQAYRVIRKHARPKRQRGSGQSSLDLLVAGNGDFRVISGTSIRETEQKIKDTLHMDYDTFINSAFLRQGHADEFTIASPARRKQVLADILDLSFYDQIEEQAKEQAKLREAERALAESSIQDIRDELAQKPTHEAELAQTQSELVQIEEVLKESETGLSELRQKKEMLESKQQQLDQLEKHLAETTRTLGLWNSQIEQHRSRISSYEKLIASRKPIEEGYANYLEAKKLSDELDQKLRLVTALNDRKYRSEMAIVQSSQALLNEHALAERKINELETSFQQLPQLKSELRQTQTELDGLAGEDELLGRRRQSEQQLRTDLHNLESDKSRLGVEIAGLAERLGLLETQTGAVCPLCERELGQDHRQLIEAKYSEERNQKTESLKSRQTEVLKKQGELNSTAGETSQLETRLNQHKTSSQTRAGLLSRQIEEVEKTAGQLAEERNRLSEIQERLVRKDFAANEQEALGRIETELAGLDYDPQHHEQIGRRMTDLQENEDPRRQLEEADRLIKQERAAAAAGEQAARDLGRSLEEGSQGKQALSIQLSSMPQLTADLSRADSEYQGLSSRQRQIQETVGGLKGRLQRYTDLERRVKEKEELLRHASSEETIYRELAQAFGKKGIQAWLIEMALPELEIETNKLLGRMTDNRMHVKIESQRETRKGDTVETLDIKIADELGTRNYEMFSGGEAFRINFAIRIALSKLLARRAGAPLPTLIIDEGFGTQDASGLEKLKEAITSIQDDFKKIIVITHIEELKDAFPTRIDVVKTVEGSTIEVN